MREIKFRAYLDDFEEMHYNVWFVESQLYVDLDGKPWDVLDLDERVHVMQYTGLKDNNGKEIYEGDIVREHGNDYTPIYQNGIYMAYNVDKINDPYISTQFNVIWRNGCEVIGNIYENPELREVSS